MKQQPTSVLVLSAICILGIYDFFAVYMFPKAPSISQFFQDIQVRAPFTMIVLAICFGHLAFPTRKVEG